MSPFGVLLGLLAVSVPLSVTAQSTIPCVRNTTYPNRLPATVVQPLYYQLNISLPDPSNYASTAYPGNIALDVWVYEPTSCIILHGKGITINTADPTLTVVVDLAGNTATYTSTAVEYSNDGNDFVVLHFNPVDWNGNSKAIPQGAATLNIPFTANFQETPGAALFLSDNSYNPADYPPLTLAQLYENFQSYKHKRGDHVTEQLAAQWMEDSQYLFPGTTEPKYHTDTHPVHVAPASAPAPATNIHTVTKDPPPPATQLRMFATQFESNFARMAFPCMDEPALKAVWSARITVPSGLNLTVLFNSDVDFVSAPYNVNGVMVQDWNFKQMKHAQSSYLVAIAVGQFDYVETNRDNVRFRVYTPPGRSQYGQFALNISASIVHWFSTKWNFYYANMNSKMDQISVPGVYQNAMENWGLLTYYPPFLLADASHGVDDPASRVALELVAQVTVHEIAHQWFGDTITMPYWSSEYLQEGYARFLQYVGVDALFPEWQVFTSYEKSNAFGFDISFYGWPYSTALRVDFAGLAPPVVVPENQKALSNMFYEKGASVNRMFYEYFGADTWHSVFAYHLNIHPFSNPNVIDLCNSFNAIIPTRNWTDPILSWLTQPNLPVVRLKWDADKGTLTYSQSPLSKYTPLGISPLWWIPAVPITFSSPQLQQPFTWHLEFSTSANTSQIPIPDGVDLTNVLVVGNMNFTHYILMDYELSFWSSVIAAYTNPNPDSIDYEYRSQFINAVVLLTTMSHQPVDLLIQLTYSIGNLFSRCLISHDLGSVLDWSTTLLNGWLRIYNALSSNVLSKKPFPVTRIFNDIEAAINSVGTVVLNDVTWNSTTPEQSPLRSLWTFWSVYYGSSSSLQIADAWYNSTSNPLLLPSDIKRAVLWSVLSQSDHSYYIGIYRNLTNLAFASTTLPPDRTFLLQTLVGAVPTLGQCLEMSHLIVNSIHEPSVQLPLFSYGMKYHHEVGCINQYFYEYQQVANRLWAINGVDATTQIINGLSGALSSGADRSNVSSWLSSQSAYVTPDQIHVILTQIDINHDIVVENTPF